MGDLRPGIVLCLSLWSLQWPVLCFRVNVLKCLKIVTEGMENSDNTEKFNLWKVIFIDLDNTMDCHELIFVLYSHLNTHTHTHTHTHIYILKYIR